MQRSRKKSKDSHVAFWTLLCGSLLTWLLFSCLNKRHSGGVRTFVSSRKRIQPPSFSLSNTVQLQPEPGSLSLADMVHVQSSLDCGAACTYVVPPSKKIGALEGTKARSFDCPRTWLRLLSSCPAQAWPPPESVPLLMQKEYTMDGTATVSNWYWQQKYSGADALESDWDELDLTKRIAAPNVVLATDGVHTYTLNTSNYVDNVLSLYSNGVRGRSGLVWGSEKPWAEIILARHGADHVLTVEYGRIASTHSKISATTPQNFAAYMAQTNKRVDFVFTYSSLEHSGLGRYGDSLNPFGDIEAASQSWCALKPGGLFFLGLPSSDEASSKDELVWNAHRLYGPRRLAEMFAGFEFIASHREGSAPQESIIHVLRKPITSIV